MPFSCVCLCVSLLALCVIPVRAEDHNSTAKAPSDAELIARIHNALDAGIAAKKLADFVGSKPTIDTANNPQDMGVFELADIAYDRSRMKYVPDSKLVKDVAYWGLNAPSKNPAIIGILYLQNGDMIPLYGEVLPP